MIEFLDCFSNDVTDIIENYDYIKIGQCPYSGINIYVSHEIFNNEVIHKISSIFGYDYQYGGKERILTGLMENGFCVTIYNENLPFSERLGEEDEVAFYLITPKKLIDYLNHI